MMTKEQIKVFEELLKSKETRGKKELRHLLWLNTTNPKFQIGECFEVTDRGHRIFGYPVKDFKAKIKSIHSWRNEEEYSYELEVEVECDGKMTTATVYKNEKELIKRCDDNKNILGIAKSEHAEESDI